MATISTQHARHSTSVEVASRLAMGATIRSEDAAAIASWFQTPGGYGAEFAALASGRDVDSDDIIEAITRELASGEHDADPAVTWELEALAAWVGRQL